MLEKRDVDDRMNVVWEWKVMAKENLWSGLNQVRQREQDQTLRGVKRETWEVRQYLQHVNLYFEGFPSVLMRKAIKLSLILKL